MRKALIYLLFAAGAGVCVGFRYNQLVNMIDPNNGFFKSEYAGSNFSLVMTIMLCVFFVSLLILTLLDDDTPSSMPTQSMPLGIITYAYTALTLFFAVKTAFTVTLNVQNAVLIAAALAFSVFMLLFAIKLTRETVMSRAVFLIPVVFSGYRLAIVFLSYFGLAKTSDIVLETVMLCCCMVFWHLFGKFGAQVGVKSTKKWLFGVGLCTALICFVCTVPVLYAGLFNRGGFDSVRNISDELYFDFGTGLYILLFLIFTYMPSAKAALAENGETKTAVGE